MEAKHAMFLSLQMGSIDHEAGLSGSISNINTIVLYK